MTRSRKQWTRTGELTSRLTTRLALEEALWLAKASVTENRPRSAILRDLLRLGMAAYQQDQTP